LGTEIIIIQKKKFSVYRFKGDYKEKVLEIKTEFDHQIKKIIPGVTIHQGIASLDKMMENDSDLEIIFDKFSNVGPYKTPNSKPSNLDKLINENEAKVSDNKHKVTSIFNFFFSYPFSYPFFLVYLQPFFALYTPFFRLQSLNRLLANFHSN
jgi:hypothetical protein